MSENKEMVQSAPKEEPTPQGKKLKKGEYIEGLGRRKRATARVRIYSDATKAVSKGGLEINGKKAEEFFTMAQEEVAVEPLKQVTMDDKLSMSIQVKGGGPTGQAEATRMGLSRALVKLEPTFKGKLKRYGFLTRDPREKERKKPGLKKARRAPQFSKR